MFEVMADVLGESWEFVLSVFYRVKNGPIELRISPMHTSLFTESKR
jgi:hypothetical protein